MIISKKKNIYSLILIIALLTTFVSASCSSNSATNTTTEINQTTETESTTENSSPNDEEASVESVISPHDEVVDVNIDIDEDVYQEMLNNATDEEYVMANITYNGYTFDNISIRPKGNSSLSSVVKSTSDRYSFKIDFNYHEDDQDFLGVTKINLNNIYKDPTMMAEYLGYEMLEDLDAASSRTTYVSLSINGEYFGLYLAVEQVNNSFLEESFDNRFW